MKYIFIFLLGLITFQVNAQKIIGSTTTAGGDLQGTYPNPTIKNNIINRANLTQGLRDSLLRFRKDTAIVVNTGTINWAALATTFGKYNRVNVHALVADPNSVQIVIPTAADTLKNTEFRITAYTEDTTSNAIVQIYGFDGFPVYYDGTDIVTQVPTINLRNRHTLIAKPFKVSTTWYYNTSLTKDWLANELNNNTTGITALTGAVTGSGSGSVVTTLSSNVVGTNNIINGTIGTLDIANSAITTALISDLNVTTGKLADDAVTSLKVLDNSLTGSDLTYLTLRAGTTSNASLQLTSGSDKTTLTGGEILYNGTRFAVGIGSSKRRVVTTSDAAASNGQIPIGNGSDFTNATITAGSNITITNGTGSITIAQTVVPSTHVAVTDADVDISTQINASQTTVLSVYLTNSTTRTITVPVPSVGLVGRQIKVLYNATAHGFGGIILNSAAGYNEFWNPDQVSTYLGIASSIGGWNVTPFATINYTCRLINGQYYWCQDSYFDPFWGSGWSDDKTSITGNTVAFDNGVTDGAFNPVKLQVFKNGLLQVYGVDYSVTDSFPLMTISVTVASVSGDRWVYYFNY